jgi:hypothetical protein
VPEEPSILAVICGNQSNAVTVAGYRKTALIAGDRLCRQCQRPRPWDNVARQPRIGHVTEVPSQEVIRHAPTDALDTMPSASVSSVQPSHLFVLGLRLR